MELEYQQTIETQQGSRNFKELYENHYCDVFSQVQKRIYNKEITANITQQVFLDAIKSIKRYNYKKYSLSIHLYKTVVNKCTDFFKSNRNKRYIVVDEEMSENLLNQIGVVHCGEGKRTKLIKALEILSIEEIELLELRFSEKKLFHEQGYILNMSENMAKLKTYSLLNKIKNLMGGKTGAVKITKRVEVIDKERLTSKEKIKLYMSFDALWKEFKNNRVTTTQVLREALSYLEGQILRRAFVSISFIALFAVFANYFLPDQPKAFVKESPPNFHIQELEIDRINQTHIVYQQDLACLNV